MKAVLISLLLFAMSASAYAQTPTREEAVQIWKITHPKSGSVATEVRSGETSLEFPNGPIISQRNIDLPPVKVQGSWTRWSIPATITLRARTFRPAAMKPLPRAGQSWRLFARLKDGRVVEARKAWFGTDLIVYPGDGQLDQRYSARFALPTYLSTRRELEAKMASGASVMFDSWPTNKPLLWRDVTELWLIDVPSLRVTTTTN